MRILVIEDEPRILGFLKVGLEAEGFAVDGAEDGVSGLALALCEPYELVVLDLQLPQLDGLRLLDELHRGRPELPVLILSARTDLPTKLRSFQLGANDYLSKPFSFDELVARVRVQLRHGSSEDASTVRVAGLELDLARRQARVEDRVTDLSDREFRLLYHLVAHAGEVVSRERLLSEVWGYSFDPGSNVVDVCIRRLRKKLGPESPIETVRHAGYRLAVA
ncbi:MAG TPA: response regulator transcription factor [Gaiellaceae bacterium]|jgi:two-component system, OmpR family, response regulator|nr:response regulator transcription factor [Gaiellaceae bacterium]